MSNTATLTSLDLVDISGSRHDNVGRSIKRAFDSGKVSMPPLEKGPVGKGGRVVSYYVFRGEQGKRDSYLVIDKMTSSMAQALAARWREIEGRHADTALATRASQPIATQVTRIVSPQADEPTMNSLEIAQLTGKNHADVMRDIRKMVEDLGGEVASKSAVYSASNGKANPCYNLPRRETDILLTGYSIPMRARVIDRWRELEAQVAKPAFSVPTSFAEALRLAGELEEQRVALTHQVGIQAAKIAEDAPKAKFHDKVADSEGLKAVAEVAKILGTGEKRLFKYLRKHKILISEGATRNTPYQPYLDSGRMDVKCTDYTVPETGKVKIHSQPLFTGKGLIWIQQYIEEHGRVGL